MNDKPTLLKRIERLKKYKRDMEVYKNDPDLSDTYQDVDLCLQEIISKLELQILRVEIENLTERSLGVSSEP